MSRNTILVADDEPGVRFAISDFLSARGYQVHEAESCRATLETFRRVQPDLVILDYALGDGDALELLPSLKEADPSAAVVILTAHGSIDLAVKAIKEGAEQFLTKPLDLATLALVIERTMVSQRSRQKELARARRPRAAFDPFVGQSEAIGRLREQVMKVVGADSAVLIQGETGTGKGVLARWLHDNSPRAEEAFVDLNCGGLSGELLDSELFGHEKGAFTGATISKPGLLEVAHRGTVFLDEVGDMDPLVQSKLLKVLEEKRFRRVGDVRDRQVDIRLTAATHQDVSRLLADKRMRADLYYRICTIPLVVPPLRERVQDIPLLARAILLVLDAHLRHGITDLDPGVERALQAYSWPGNIRELRNVLERAVLLSEGGITTRDLFLLGAPAEAAPAEPAPESRLTLLELEQRHIERVLREEDQHVERAARRLGIPRSSLYEKIKKFGLGPSRD